MGVTIAEVKNCCVQCGYVVWCTWCIQRVHVVDCDPVGEGW